MTGREIIEPLKEPIAANRQGAKRHYGVHPYFTRRPYNVVREYILHYSKEKDHVLDPFGGSGVTAIEAFLENRTGVQNDINPLANFIAKGVVGLAKGNSSEYKAAVNELKERCEKRLAALQDADEKGLAKLGRGVKLPDNIKLPSNADVEFYHDLFSKRQLLSLAVIREGVDDLKSGPARAGMLLAWSATLAKLNKTFLSAEGRAESRGGSSIFSIYRYKIAKNPVELRPWATFEERAVNIIDAKAEIDKTIQHKEMTSGWHGEFEVHAKDIAELEKECRGKIDYIFTDPPYGGHISYLDLSTLWNVWLGHNPSIKARERELIVGGELNHTEALYTSRLSDSVRACVNMLKKGRWLSIVFQHWNISYFEAILTGAAEAGAELRAAISQVGDPIWSMHKKKGNQSVLAGELILTFVRTGKPQYLRNHGELDVVSTVGEILEAAPRVVYGEQLFNQLVIQAWQKSAIGSLNISKDDFTKVVKHHGWHYDEDRHYWVRNRDQDRHGSSAPMLWEA
ncbi:MAG TPA: DNA methyltransferase [Terriglobales bacterium]|nr:DNA methyltransferase [Terriglobales bacterium]